MNKIKSSLLLLLGSTLLCSQSAQAVDLIQVYQQALKSDPTYLQAEEQYKSDLEGVPIARASILPTLSLINTGTYTQAQNKGLGSTVRGLNKSKAFEYDLQLTQTIFDMAQFNTLGEAKITVKASAATFNAALQTLMSTVATDYFAVLKAQEDVRYSRANMLSLGRQLEQTTQQYRVGLKTRTDVDLAQSSYDNAVADFITKVNDLSNAREDLRAVTGVNYDHLSILQEDLPLIAPFPANPNKWVDVAVKQNWALLSQSYTAQAARKEVSVQWDANLPTLSLQADYTRSQTRSWYDGTTFQGTPSVPTPTPASSATAYGPQAVLTLTIPIVEGGATVANTQQAEYNYGVEQQKYNGDKRDTINQTRQAYLTILSKISTIKADKQAIISGESALRGNVAGYKVGTKTMVDVLKAQDTLFQAQTTYAEDRFSYITSSIKLKEETGTLSINDLRAINRWLVNKPAPDASYYKVPTLKVGRVTQASHLKTIGMSNDDLANTTSSQKAHATQAKPVKPTSANVSQPTKNATTEANNMNSNSDTAGILAKPQGGK